jgi:UDP-N-acetylglucosamine:LPS N-acetylglucosamine transferase
MVPQAELTTERLSNEVGELFKNAEELVTMASAAKNLSHPNAAAEIAAMAVRVAGKRGKAARV